MQRRFAILLILLGGALNVGLLTADERADPASAGFFETKIRPVLAAKCLKCHGEKKQESKLRLDSLANMLKGGESGDPAIVKGKPDESVLIDAIKYESYEMPPTGKLAQDDIQNFVRWIAAGAVWPESSALIREENGLITASDREWWAFQPLEKPAVPELDGDAWSQNEIDKFVLRKLRERKMQPAPQADKVRLVRRLYYDLIGLPPSPDEVDAFLNDSSPQAWENLIDRLLADKRYGEHWGRYWLDVVRYAESDGWNQDAFRPNIWRYRDYVVRSFNDDKPYPQFVREQLAGDEIPGDDPDNLAATGYLRLGIYEYNQRDARSHWNDIMNEMVDVTADVFLGMGMACARCHDHKFDPLLQKDYFKLRAFFEPIEWRDDQVYATDAQRAEYQKQLTVWEEKTEAIRKQIDELIEPYHDRKWASTVAKFPLDIQECFRTPVEQRTSWDQQMAYLVSRQFEEEGGGPLKSMKKADKERLDELEKQLAKFDEFKPKPLPPLMTAADFSGTVSPTTIPDDPAESPIPPGFLSVLAPMAVSTSVEPEMPELPHSTGRRTALAEWIGDPGNPLTTRVIVNRIWQQHFGQGIVPTASDFGHLGLPPTHPELLDWLTVTFVENGWSMKKLHRMILTAAVWRQSVEHPQAAKYQRLDPAEDLMWRSRVRRLKAEQIRDAMLAASGELDLSLGGPSVSGKSSRRSLYVKAIRNTPDDFLYAFDVANGLKSVAERNTTTTPTQSLLMINGDWPLGRAKKMAERLQKLNRELPETVDYAFRLTWGRKPTETEREAALRFVGENPDLNKLTDFCHVLFNSNEFLYVD